MLKLAPNKIAPKAAPVVEPEPEPVIAEAPAPKAKPAVPVQDEPQQDVDAGKLPQQLVVYMGSEDGPFQCDNCRYFEAPSTCEKVAESVDPGGHCNIFYPMEQQVAQDEATPEAPDA